jgi:hypothetical protein
LSGQKALINGFLDKSRVEITGDVLKICSKPALIETDENTTFQMLAKNFVVSRYTLNKFHGWEDADKKQEETCRETAGRRSGRR